MSFPTALLGDIPSGLGDALSMLLGLASFAILWVMVLALARV